MLIVLTLKNLWEDQQGRVVSVNRTEIKTENQSLVKKIVLDLAESTTLL